MSKTPEQAIEDTIEAFRKNITKKYLIAIQLHQYEVQKIIKKFYENPANEGKDAPEIPELEIETSDQTKSLYKKWEPLLVKYKEITGKTYKKPILFNENKEKSKKAGLKEKLDARQLRDALLAKKEASKPVPKAKPKPVPKNTGYAEAKKLYNKPLAQLEEIILQSASVPTKVKSGLFASMKDLIKTEEKAEQEIKVDKRALFKANQNAKKAEQELKVAKQDAKKAEQELKVDKRSLFKAKQERAKKIKSIPELQPWYPEEHGNKDRTGRLMSDKEIAQLQQIRAKLKQSKIPENIVVKKRGRPVVEGSKRQTKLAEPVTAPKRRGRPAKKVPVEETKEETRQEETKEEPVPKRRGRPVVQGSKRQARLAVPTKNIGRPKKIVTEPAVPVKRGRPTKCSKVPAKSDEKMPVTHVRPIINWFEIKETKVRLKAIERVSDKLLKYNKLKPYIFFETMEKILPVQLGNEILTGYDKRTSRQALYVLYRKIAKYVIGTGLTTAFDIEQELVARITSELKDEPKKLQAFENFVKRNCVAKPQGDIQELEKSVSKSSKPKKLAIQYPLEKLVIFSDTIYDLKSNNFIDIINNTFKNKQLNIKRTGNVFERVESEEDEEDDTIDNVWAKVGLNLITNAIINNLLDYAEENDPKKFVVLNQQYEDNSDEIKTDVKEWLNNL